MDKFEEMIELLQLEDDELIESLIDVSQVIIFCSKLSISI